MKALVACGLAALFLAGCVNAGAPLAQLSRAAAIVARSKRASECSAWDASRAATNREPTPRRDQVQDLFNLRRYGMRVVSERGGTTRAMGFNGQTSWMTKRHRRSRRTQRRGSLQEAITTAYLSNNAFFFPNRFPANFNMRAKRWTRAHFDVGEVTPAGGRALECGLTAARICLRVSTIEGLVGHGRGGRLSPRRKPRCCLHPHGDLAPTAR